MRLEMFDFDRISSIEQEKKDDLSLPRKIFGNTKNTS